MADHIPVGAGLCRSCRHAHAIVSAKGSVFVQCGLSFADTTFPKYPPLPVRECRGYEEKFNRAAGDENPTER